MAITVDCEKCSHAWTVPTAKAGRTVHCPQCDETVVIPRPKAEPAEPQRRERLRPGQRPKTESGAGARIVLLGAIVVFIGVVSLVGIRIARLMSDDNMELDTSPITNLTGGGSAPEDAPGNRTDNNDSAAVTVPDGLSGEPDTSESQPLPEVPNAGSLTADGLAQETRRRSVLAQLTSIAVDLDTFLPDRRGTVSHAVEGAVQGAMERCQLTVDDASSNVMEISLELKSTGDSQSLTMNAILLAELDGEPIPVWQRSKSLGPITDQAFTSGILPPGLERETASFFTGLRGELVKVRREFAKSP